MMVMTATLAPTHYESPVREFPVDRHASVIEPIVADRPTADQLWQNAQELEDLGRYSEVLTVLDQIIELDPRSFSAWYWRGAMLGSLGHYEAAIAAYDQARRLKPYSFLVGLERGIMQGFFQLSRWFL